MQSQGKDSKVPDDKLTHICAVHMSGCGHTAFHMVDIVYHSTKIIRIDHINFKQSFNKNYHYIEATETDLTVTWMSSTVFITLTFCFTKKFSSTWQLFLVKATTAKFNGHLKTLKSIN